MSRAGSWSTSSSVYRSDGWSSRKRSRKRTDPDRRGRVERAGDNLGSAGGCEGRGWRGHSALAMAKRRLVEAWSLWICSLEGGARWNTAAYGLRGTGYAFARYKEEGFGGVGCWIGPPAQGSKGCSALPPQDWPLRSSSPGEWQVHQRTTAVGFSNLLANNSYVVFLSLSFSSMGVLFSPRHLASGERNFQVQVSKPSLLTPCWRQYSDNTLPTYDLNLKLPPGRLCKTSSKHLRIRTRFTFSGPGLARASWCRQPGRKRCLMH